MYYLCREMKKNTTLIFLLLSGLVFSQTKHKSIVQYYSSRTININSIQTPYLYYQIYNWVGVKYRYSGNTKKGIDCSGFVTEIYKNVYCIQLEGGSRNIFKHVTTTISKNNLKEGDLVFFKIRKGRISHVGIYLAHNKFAHATTKTGVTISDLNDDYYKKYFYKGGRLTE